MNNFIKQNKLFFIKKIIFCLFFICSFQNIFTMQEPVDITKYINENIADPRIEAQFLKDILRIGNNIAPGPKQGLILNIHNRLESILKKKKGNRAIDNGDLRETENSIKMAIRRNLIPDITGIYENLLNLKKEDFDAFANIKIPQEIPFDDQDFFNTFFKTKQQYQNFKERSETKNILSGFRFSHSTCLFNLEFIPSLSRDYKEETEAIKEKYILMFNKCKSDLTKELNIALDNIKDNISQQEKIRMEANEIFKYIKQEYNFFEEKLSERRERIRIEREEIHKKIEDDNRKFMKQVEERQKKEQYEKQKKDATSLLKNDPIIQNLLANFEAENLIFLEEAEKYKFPFYRLNFSKMKFDYDLMYCDIKKKIQARVKELKKTKKYDDITINCIISNEEEKIFNDLVKKEFYFMDILYKNDSIRTNNKKNLAVITTTVILTIGYLAYYSYNKNKEYKQDLEIILNQLKDKLSQEKIEQLIKKRSTFFQKYLPIWMKRIFGMQYDWKNYLAKIANLSAEELEGLNLSDNNAKRLG
ncbi:MAG: hypothetical protein WC436_02950 [Candidatus Babeliales bacterium]